MNNKKKRQEKSRRGFFSFFKAKSSRTESKIDTLFLDLDSIETVDPIDEKIMGVPSEDTVVTSKIETMQIVVGDQANELEDGTNILKPRNVISRKPVFEKPKDAKKYCDDLFVYFKENGLSIEKNTIREMLSCMAASRMIIVKNESRILAERFIELFSSFIGANYYKDRFKGDLSSFDDLFAGGYHYEEAILAASNEKNRIHISSLKNVKLSELPNYFNTFMEYVWNPLMPCEIRNRNFTGVDEMPNNVWFIVIPESVEDKIDSKELALSATTLDLKAKIVEPKEEVFENEFKLSYEDLTNLLYEGYDTHYVQESQWKKLDKIEEYLTVNAFYKFDNRLFRQLERYTSTYLQFGGDSYQAMDNVLYLKLLPVISLLEIHEKADAEENLFQLFERHFGLENLTRSKNSLKDIQENIQQNR